VAGRYQLGPVDQIPHGEGRAFDLGGRRVAVFRSRDGRVFASQAECPHRKGPLVDGLVGAGTVVCPLHEWRFDLETGATQNGSCPIEVYRVSLGADGSVTVELP
jgi:nitrite reductase (NADH) small subunit